MVSANMMAAVERSAANDSNKPTPARTTTKAPVPPAGTHGNNLNGVNQASASAPATAKSMFACNRIDSCNLKGDKDGAKTIMEATSDGDVPTDKLQNPGQGGAAMMSRFGARVMPPFGAPRFQILTPHWDRQTQPADLRSAHLSKQKPNAVTKASLMTRWHGQMSQRSPPPRKLQPRFDPSPTLPPLLRRQVLLQPRQPPARQKFVSWRHEFRTSCSVTSSTRPSATNHPH